MFALLYFPPEVSFKKLKNKKIGITDKKLAQEQLAELIDKKDHISRAENNGSDLTLKTL